MSISKLARLPSLAPPALSANSVLSSWSSKRSVNGQDTVTMPNWCICYYYIVHFLICALQADSVLNWIAVQPNVDGLFPSLFFKNHLKGKVTLGARGDSFYEYLLKEWLLTGRRDTLPRELYDASVNGIASRLLLRSTPSLLLYVAELEDNQIVHKMDHLVCFLPGVLALDHLVVPNATRLAVSRELMETCFHLYSRTATRLAPEIAKFRPLADAVDDSQSMHNLLRPETVESLFILWRVTKEQKYRLWGENIFRAFERHSQTAFGFSGVKNVQQDPPEWNNEMPSFFLAETLKYLYLLFSEDDILPIQQFVFNTEAHPLPVFNSTRCGRGPLLDDSLSPVNDEL
eukprot:GILJ01006559.1.p1 GENE.GILJ01006559.1~~GILJ01006559.1.p1  ORF type:complete len:345 (-),score=27.10 GILJ01006559.1:127-1161(-)